MVVRRGSFIEEYIDEIDTGASVSEAAVQPNGVDLSIDTIYGVEGTPRLTDSDYDKGSRVELTPNEDGFYNLDEGVYIVQYGERISIPTDHVGLVLPRSRMMRCGISVETAVWDAGYEGGGEGALRVGQEVEVAEDMRIAQLILFQTEELDETYDGHHQAERL